MWTVQQICKHIKERERRKKGKYPWIEHEDERRNMSDRGILDKYIDLDESCLSDSEKKQLMDMLYKHKDTFSLRDEIGTCPNIEVEIDVTDKSPFFSRPYHDKYGDEYIGQGDEKIVLSRYIKKFSAY